MDKRRGKFVGAAVWVFLCGLSFANASAKVSETLFETGPVNVPGVIDTLPGRYDVVWNTPGPGSAQSMPIGNGDIGLNVWVEKNGDLVFFIGKTDAWGEDLVGQKDEWMRHGGVLMKLGAIRISVKHSGLSVRERTQGPAKGSAHFRQALRLGRGEIEIEEGSGRNGVAFRVWVDANHPVIRVEMKSGSPVNVKVRLEDWRAETMGGTSDSRGSNGSRSSPDTILQDLKNRIAWYHHNSATADPHLANLCFGAVVEGDNLVKGGGRVKAAGTGGQSGGGPQSVGLLSEKPMTEQVISIYPLTSPAISGAAWYAKVDKQVSELAKLDLAKTRASHRQWWKDFWQRSWVFVDGDELAQQVTEGYLLQRFVTACAGRGAYPVKFNGSIFVVDKPSAHINADWRDWGGQYWFQNTRAMYWPRLMAGDFDIMQPLFKMYADMLSGNTEQVRQYYHHEGAYFAETSPFWGGLDYTGPESKANYTAHYFTPILELSMMMLDYYEYTGDTSFARKMLLPVASAGLQFFGEHFGRDSAGKLLLDPDNANETYWKVHNPAPDIAGLQAVITRMMDLSASLVDEQSRSYWKKIYRELPSLPMGYAIDSIGNSDRQILLPYTGPQTAESSNSENPALYAVYPFRLFGLTRPGPGLELAANTFYLRKNRDKGCWTPDAIQAAMIGDANTAKEYMSFDLTNRDSVLKFPAFWLQSDYVPDEDNGGNGEKALQQMLMQVDGKKILLLPAWPAGWNADFKLHAPFRTTVEGKVVGGKIIRLRVEPASRLDDVIDMSEKKLIFGR